MYWGLLLLWLSALGFLIATASYANGYLLSLHGFIPALLAAMGLGLQAQSRIAAPGAVLVTLIGTAFWLIHTIWSRRSWANRKGSRGTAVG